MEITLETLIDRAAIIDLAVAYTRGIDSQDWQSACAVFAENATVDYGSRVGAQQGREEIAALLSATLTGLNATQHLVGNHTVTVDGDRATHSCYLVAQHIRSGLSGGEVYTVGGSYEDELARTDGGWLITHRRLVRSWRTGNPAVITGAQPT